MQYVFFFVQCLSLNIRFIQGVHSSFLFITEQYSIVWIYTVCLFIPQMMNIWVVSSLRLVQINCSGHSCKSLCMESAFISLGQIPKREMAGPYGRYMYNFLRNCQTIFPGGCTILHSQQQCMRVPYQYFIRSAFFMLLILLAVSHCGFNLNFHND